MCFINNDGFTLLEVIVAIVVSAFILIGVVMLSSSVFKAKEIIDKQECSLKEVVGFVNLVSSDIRGALGKMRFTEGLEGERIVFDSLHSLLYGGSSPVRVEYYSAEWNGRRYFYRKECSKNASRCIEIPLSSMIEDVNFSFYKNGTWSKIPSKIVKVSFKCGNKAFSFAVREIDIEK